MYAVIETGGKQYRVEVGTEFEVELLDVEPGKTITLERVLLVADGTESSIGRPLVAGAEVSAEVVRQIRGEKLISFKYRPKARSRVKKGHRQELTVLRINDITLGGKSAATSARKAQDDARTERQRLEEAAKVQAARDAELAALLAVGSEGDIKPASQSKAAPVTAKAAKSQADSKAAKAGAEAATAEAKPAKPPAERPEPKTAASAAKTEAKAQAKAPSKAAKPAKPAPSDSKATDTGPATTAKITTAKPGAGVAAPKRARPKPAAEADASTTTPETPRRTRATKKDE
jgi:large subunit ribosomal protein L21